jgi:two-component system, chemotaxis family, chemotaxis protein CheY
MLVKNAKFLLIDDDPFIRNELIASLRKLDFQGPFVEVNDGLEAIQALKNNHSAPVNFIFCDIYMPNMDGLSFLAEIKKEQIIDEPTPILMLTAENDRKVVVECLKLGASNYLLKPWNQPDLAKKIVSSWEKIHKLTE